MKNYEMRRKDREMDKDFAMYVVDKCPYAVLSMIDDENMPYCVPITIVRKNDTVYFHSAKAGKKNESLKKNPDVCITFVGDVVPQKDKFTTEYESAVAYGKAEEVSDDKEKIIALRLLCERYTPDNMRQFDDAITASLPRTAIWSVKLISITGKRKKYDSRGKEMKFGRME